MDLDWMEWLSDLFFNFIFVLIFLIIYMRFESTSYY